MLQESGCLFYDNLLIRTGQNPMSAIAVLSKGSVLRNSVPSQQGSSVQAPPPPNMPHRGPRLQHVNPSQTRSSHSQTVVQGKLGTIRNTTQKCPGKTKELRSCVSTWQGRGSAAQ